MDRDILDDFFDFILKFNALPEAVRTLARVYELAPSKPTSAILRKDCGVFALKFKFANGDWLVVEIEPEGFYYAQPHDEKDTPLQRLDSKFHLYDYLRWKKLEEEKTTAQ